MKDQSLNSIITPEFRVSYPNVFVAKKNMMNGKEEYSIVALFPKGTDLTALKQAAAKAIEKKWGDKKPKKLKTPFRDQGEREKEDGTMPDGYTRGCIFMNFKSVRAPGIVDQKRQPIIDAEKFYAGCWARADVSCYAYDVSGSQGVSFGLNNLQLVRDDEPFSGRRKAEDSFTPIATEEDSSGTSDPFSE